MITRSDAAPAPASMLSPSSRYNALFLSTTTRVESAGTEIVEAIAIGDPPDFVINTDASAAFVPSMFATKILLTLKTFPEDPKMYLEQNYKYKDPNVTRNETSNLFNSRMNYNNQPYSLEERNKFVRERPIHFNSVVLARKALTDCPAIGTSDTFRDFAEKLSRCVDTPAIRELEAYINSYNDTRGSFWRFMARLCCTVGGMASSATGGDGDPACCDHWDTE